MKNTQRRAAILEQVIAAGGPVSAEEIFERLQGRFPTLALSTVYRNLEKLAEDGLVEKEASPEGVFLYCGHEEHGHYLICTQCHQRVRLLECPLSEVESKLEKQTGFLIDRHHLTIYGKCPKCRLHKK